ncbi:hypothetical protein [Bradyrhizobium sp. BR 10289]|uniref:hypothetical protein n=1 Tax=Bradyrhizobium sp. BR 10289 TaxID=2749993 RepID=UPI001C64C543|nr:hypothetical protein [Bradyrhizobium sp. BR 10289]MBW7972357.1 hypothetical protein [Bradyrhizobium sp. BR 10289]
MVETLLSGPNAVRSFASCGVARLSKGRSEASFGISAPEGPDQGAFASKPGLRNFRKAID